MAEGNECIIKSGKVYAIHMQANLAHMVDGAQLSHSSMKQPRGLTLPTVWDVSSYPAIEAYFWGWENAIVTILDFLQIKHGGYN